MKAVDEDLLTVFCFHHGASGMSEKLDFTQEQDDYEPITLEKEIKEIVVYFESRPNDDFFLNLQKEYPETSYTFESLENKDWLEEWKKGYESFCLCGSTWVVPSWKERPTEATEVIKIDPGMAFGTGTHATTQVAAKILSEMNMSGKSLIDVGTGTGILAILAKQLKAGDVAATEIDPVARQVAKENVALNGFEDISVYDFQIEDVTKKYDVVVANIIDGILLKIQEPLRNALNTKGNILLTGILEERETQFVEKFQWPAGMGIIKRLQKDEWVGLLIGELD